MLISRNIYQLSLEQAMDLSQGRLLNEWWICCYRFCGHSIAVFAGSNPAQGMDVRLLCLLSCAGKGPCDEMIGRSEDSCRVCACLIKCDLETSRMWHSIFSYISPSITCFRRHLLRTMWPIQWVFLLFIAYTIFLSCLTLYNTSFLTRFVHLISIHLQLYNSKRSTYLWCTFWRVQTSGSYKSMLRM